ncbi:hypothetical protein NLG97_g2550 [Lecanicillium saksenae]|uniref:Uncharacterized protein n=1 Tax=Lecanicillium saksenae TaxID=468837 RepID=A0ACC1R2F0_9HYPO|nr:hypothetical protein NLG97_g2550 [Lecanicillium saksenae]
MSSRDTARFLGSHTMSARHFALGDKARGSLPPTIRYYQGRSSAFPLSMSIRAAPIQTASTSEILLVIKLDDISSPERVEELQRILQEALNARRYTNQLSQRDSELMMRAATATVDSRRSKAVENLDNEGRISSFWD